MLFSVAIGLLSMAVILLSIPVVSKMVLLNEQAHKYMVGMFLILSVYMIGRCICTVVINGVFYAGGEVTPLPELPFQAEKCWDRIRYVFRVNQVKKPYDVTYEEKDKWPNPIWGIDGDRTEVYRDESRQANLTVQLFDSVDGVCRTALASISEQGHECREHTCEMAWQFMKQFSK